MKNVAGIPMKFKKEDMTTRAQMALTLMVYNIMPRSHTFTIPMESTYFLYCLVDGREVYVARIIANEIKAIAENGIKLLRKPNRPLAFPGLIIKLCKKPKIHIPNQV